MEILSFSAFEYEGTRSNGDKLFNEDTDKVSECLLFIPCVTFGLVVDVQIIQSTRKYKPIAFTDLPFRAARGIMLAIGVLSLLMSLASYTFCIFVVEEYFLGDYY